VEVTAAGPTISFGNPTKVLATKYYPGFTELGINLRGYDVSPDAKRFLMLKDAPTETATRPPPPSMVVMINWLDEIKARITAK
jgi:hypothetical protein